ncbi:hypothetical protein SPBR_07567 [Sporothrix brasiliensis 5110]|uniref:Uncharacterized protein n=1 Tax=Sporothrix brasiliensis 5110 TaxID=1398154 RepID=A0A0C2IJM1_9PEZI|nr:uncharacterized protein SPBR_07567 [Sporothrix brasiliensis 5110]KIH89361.1 hypothetical protein SPBR_07567 [Sporothrix brasiliensis 5110]
MDKVQDAAQKEWRQEWLQFLGDGFSGDEAKARPHKTRKRVKSDSSNSVGSSSKRKKKADASPILGSLDIVSLSQEESAIDMAAAAGAALAAAKATSRINTVMEIIPLRPLQHVQPTMAWDFDGTQSTVIKTEVDDANMGDDVVAIPSSCNENGQVNEIIDDEVAVHYSALPPLRHERRRSPTYSSLVALES